MQPNHFVRSCILTLVIAGAFIFIWEWYWRSKGYTTTYDDGKELWSDKRAMVYEPADKATVFIGSSRIKYDLDIPTWEKITGEKGVQLAMEGTSPRPILYDLADDENFKGKLVIDVTEGLFFSNALHNNREPAENIAYYKKRTPTQKFSFEVNHVLESKFVFLNKDYLSFNGLLSQVDLSKRAKVFVFPYFPKEFSHITFDRQSIIEEKFLTDTSLQNQVTGNWLVFASMGKDVPPITVEETQKIITSVKAAVDKIKKRGGQVLFVRTPSSGPFLEVEAKAFNREKFWNKLIRETNTPGIHFLDYPETSSFICPEWSHLSLKDAIIYTQHLVRHMEEKGWKFSNKQTSGNHSSTAKH